jgi:EAL domain-containing protein (putative c-di-GMP-specific phosphodiesterase class I)
MLEGGLAVDDFGTGYSSMAYETQHAWQQLSVLGCDIAQGYYLGRPMPAAELEQHLTQPAQAAAGIQADAQPTA